MAILGPGRYRDLNMIAGRDEYRRSLFGRFGAVAFVGAGAVAETFGNLFSRTLLRAGGGELRYLAVPASGVNISIDYVWGKSGSGGLYGYIGDVFLRRPEPMGPKSNTAVPSRALAWRATGAMGPCECFLLGVAVCCAASYVFKEWSCST